MLGVNVWLHNANNALVFLKPLVDFILFKKKSAHMHVVVVTWRK